MNIIAQLIITSLERKTLILFVLVSLISPNDITALSIVTDNAATVYERAFSNLSTITSFERNRILNSVVISPTSNVSEECKIILRRHRQARKHLLRASKIRYCDFGVKITSPSTYVEYVLQIELSSKYLLADAVHRLQSNDFEGAIESIRAIYGFVHHLEQSRFSGSSQTASSMLKYIDGVLEYANDIGAINASRSQRLLSGLSRLNKADPTGIINAASTGSDRMIFWIMDRYESGKANEINTYINLYSEENEISFDDIGETEFNEALNHATTIFDDIVRVMVETDENDQREVIKQLVESLYENELCALMFPGEYQYVSIAWRVPATKKIISEQEKMLTDLSEGKVVQEDMRDAAFLYARGATLLYAIHPDDFEKLYEIVVREGGMEPRERSKGEAVGENTKLRKAMKEIMEVYGDASTIERCDFSKLRRDLWGVDSVIMLSPDYSGGMIDIIEFMHTRIRTATHQDAGDLAGRDIQTCLRIIHHLAGDELITSSLAAHAAFNKTFTLYEKAVDRGILEPEVREEINKQFAAFAGAEPFRYLTNGKRAKRDLARCARRVQDDPQYEPMEKGQLSMVQKLLNSWAEKNPMSAIFLWSTFYYLTVGTEKEPVDEEEARNLQQRRQRFLDYIFDRGTYGQAMSNSTIIISLILNGGGEIDKGWKPTGVLNLRDQFGLARKDMRRVGAALRRIASEDSGVE